MQSLLVWYITVAILTSIDHCNISLSTITLMLQHTGMEVFDQYCRMQNQLYNIGYQVPYK